MVAQVIMVTHAAPGFAGVPVAGVTVSLVEDHVACLKK
jgi:hypothetical protein